MDKLLIICGPTATGKTALALHLAKKCNGELVSADSRQVYIGMDIGTGKDIPNNSKFHPSADGRNSKLKIKNHAFIHGYYDIDGIPLWLVDMARPDQEFSVSHYREIARLTIRDIWKRGKLPIVVGGAGLYVRALLETLPAMDIPPNPLLRRVLDTKNTLELIELLKKKDFKKWKMMNQSDRNNPRRLIRALEIASYKKEKNVTIKPSFKADALIIGLTLAKEDLFERIDRRVDERIQQGIKEEVERLLVKGYSWDLPSLDSLGYKEWRPYFERKKTVQEVINQWKFDEHAYARRQMTWFKKQPGVHWFDCTDSAMQIKIDQTVRAWYTKNRATKS